GPKIAHGVPSTLSIYAQLRAGSTGFHILGRIFDGLCTIIGRADSLEIHIMERRKMRVAIAQAAPVFLDLQKSVEKAASLMGEAARRGARLVAFGESWLPGYPAWLDLCPGSAFWDHPPAKKAYARLVENSAVIPGPATDRLCAAAREHGVVVVIGVHERVATGAGHGTLYNTQLVIGHDGTILGRHRKLVPTHAERLVWGPGDGGDLEA